MNDRIIGYCVITIIALFIITPVTIVVWKYYAPVEIRTIEFGRVNSVSFLNKQDPVRIRGVQVGSVRSVTTIGKTAIVQIESTHPLRLYNGYTINAFLKGLLGDRYINIDIGDQQSIPIRKDVVLHGNFLEGPTEIVSYVGRLKTILAQLITFTNQLKDGTADKKSLIKKFTSFTQKVDTFSLKICSSSNDIDCAIRKNSDTIQYIINQLLEITDSLSTGMPSVLLDINHTLLSANKMATKIDTLVIKTDSIVASLNDPQSNLWKNDLRSLQTDLQSISVMLQDLHENGLNLPVRLR